jgi:hypothetical protein
MTVSLLGGPLDGSVTDAPSHLPLYMIATNLRDRPVYKRIRCLKCGCDHNDAPIPYLLVGYEESSETECSHLVENI